MEDAYHYMYRTYNIAYTGVHLCTMVNKNDVLIEVLIEVE